MLKSSGRFISKATKSPLKKQFPIKKFGRFNKKHYLCTHENPPSLFTMLKSAGRFFLYGTLFKDLHIAHPVDGIATVARSPRRERHTDGELPPPHRLLQIQCIPLSPPDHTKGESCVQARSSLQSGSGHVPFRQASATADVQRDREDRGCRAQCHRQHHKPRDRQSFLDDRPDLFL